MTDTTLTLVITLLGFAVVAISGLRRVGLPPVLAYLFTGMLVGPHGLGWITNPHETQVLAEYGVVFLLFTLGLEFSVPRLVAMRREVVWLGGSQIMLTAGITGVIGWLLGLTPGGALAFGGAIAMSSTAIVIKQLKEQAEVGMEHGRRAVAVLLAQDMAVIPFLIMIPALAPAANGTLATSLGLALVKGVFAVTVIVLGGRWLLRPLFRGVAATRLAELFTLSVLLFTLAAAWLTETLGLSLALGAFVAGIMLADTEFRHQVELEIRPFRDVLLGLFFATIGMLVNAGVLMTHPWSLLGCVVALIAGKAILISLLARVLGADSAAAVRTGIVLAEGGEFGFALLALALGSQVLPPASTQFLLALILLSMIASPLLIQHNRRLARWLVGHARPSPREELEHDAERHGYGGHDHVIIAGFGRVGQNVARMLESENLDYVALDLDPARVRTARQGGDPVFFGDAAHPAILDAVGLTRARALVISHHEAAGALRILQQVRARRPELPVIVRTPDDSNLDTLLRAGATEVIPETLEAALILGAHLLMWLDVAPDRINRQVADIRHSRYRLLRDVFRRDDAERDNLHRGLREELGTVAIREGDYAAGRSIGDLKLAQQHLSVTALRRHDIVGKQPDNHTVLQAGDVLVLYGTPEDLLIAGALLATGRTEPLVGERPSDA